MPSQTGTMQVPFHLILVGRGREWTALTKFERLDWDSGTR